MILDKIVPVENGKAKAGYDPDNKKAKPIVESHIKIKSDFDGMVLSEISSNGAKVKIDRKAYLNILTKWLEIEHKNRESESEIVIIQGEENIKD